MKLNRRNIFGIAAGGIAARFAPTETQAPPIYPPQTATECINKVPGISQDYLARIKRIASGDIRDEDRNHLPNCPTNPYNCLKSVSENARRFMQARYSERQWRENTIKHAINVLNEYDKTGILRSLI